MSSRAEFYTLFFIVNFHVQNLQVNHNSDFTKSSGIFSYIVCVDSFCVPWVCYESIIAELKSL